MSDSRKVTILSVVYVAILVTTMCVVVLTTKSFTLTLLVLAAVAAASIMGVEEGRCRQRLIHNTPTNELEQQQ